MARKPQGPWWRADRGAYFVRINGKQIRLDADHGKALARFQQLISRPSGPLSVSKLVLSYLDGVQVAPLTLRTYRQRLHSFASVCGEMAAADVRPLHVTAWLQALGVGPSTQVISRRIVKICWQWATDQGHLESGPPVVDATESATSSMASANESRTHSCNRNVNCPSFTRPVFLRPISLSPLEK